MAWQKGPLPKDTYGWGGVAPVGLGTGFFFADFCGDKVKVVGGADNLELKPEEVAYYDNSLTLPPNCSQPRLYGVGP